MDVSVRQLSGWFAAIVLLAGCQGPNVSIELLESELRWMEDQLYSLDRQLDQTYLQLASAQNSNRALQRELARLEQPTPASVPGARSSGATPRRPDAVRPVPPGVEVPDADDVDPDALQAPRIELGPADDPIPSILPGPSTRPLPSEPPQVDPSLDTTGLDSAALHPAPVTRIAVNRHLTGGYDFDGHPGDEGLMVVIEPMDAVGEYVPLPGDVVIELRDPEQPPSARVARWEFDQDETVGLLRRSLLGRGIHLKLPWPGDPPRVERLLLSVQYRPAGGATLMAERPLRVDLGTGPRQTPGSAQIASEPPNPLVPSHTSRLSQLFPAPARAMPRGPLDDVDPSTVTLGSYRAVPSAPRSATRTPRSATAGRRVIPWSPYR